jgi:integrase
VLKEAWRLGLMSAEELARATDLEVVRGKGVLRGRCLSATEVERLFQVCAADTEAGGPRDATVLALGLGAGLRRAEIAGLDLSDVSLDRQLLRVLGKGHKVREVPIQGGTVAAIRAWLPRRGNTPGPLLCPVLKAGTVVLRRLSPQAIQRACEKRAGEAQVPAFTPHDLRRTYISNLLDAGVDLVVASDLVGHSSVQTTRRYDRRGARAKRRAAEVARVPYPERLAGLP